MDQDTSPPICDYEGSTYRSDFWEGQGREYEDLAERIAIRRLLPPAGQNLIEIGAGFGRLATLYQGYERVVLFDYSRSQLEYARQIYGDKGFLYVAGDIYKAPFAPGFFDTVLMVRVLHHMKDPPAALSTIRYMMHKDSIFILEYANKQNLKAILRWLLRQQSWNPFSLEPVEFVELNYDFHPRYVKQMLSDLDFTPGRVLTVSHFRIGFIKRVVPARILAALDSVAQLTGALWQLSPSVFIRSQASSADSTAPEGAFWRCPTCGGFSLAEEEPGCLYCTDCTARWGIHNGIYNFKEPLK
nr:class I SAM-dependent methyltransferase [Anaerolineae bacterium]